MFKSQADMWRDRLQKIGSGQLPLDATFARQVSPVTYKSIINRANTNIF